MLARFRAYIRRQNPTGRAALWFVYGICVAIAWLAPRLYGWVRYAVVQWWRGTFRGSIVTRVAKIAFAMVVLGYLAAQAGLVFLASNLVMLSVVPLMFVAFAVALKSAIR